MAIQPVAPFDQYLTRFVQSQFRAGFNVELSSSRDNSTVRMEAVPL